MVRIGINGFGRIGRLVVRAAQGVPSIDIVAINGTSDPKTMAHLLKYDSAYGIFEGVEPREKGILVGGKEIPVVVERDPTKLPWKHYNVDVVIESTGEFTSRRDAEKHIAAGAKRVLISAPAKDEDITIVPGVNGRALEPKHRIVSAASCTTNCLAPVAKILDGQFGIVSGLMTTVHAYTNDQRLQDGTHRDLRRARAAGLSMIPTTTGAASALHKVLPQLKGKLNGFAIRVPIATVSLVDLTVELAKPATADQINQAYREAAHGRLKGILAVSDEPLVSTDFKANPNSAIVDAPSTLVVGKLAKVIAWYDNEWGYANRLLDVAKLMGT